MSMHGTVYYVQCPSFCSANQLAFAGRLRRGQGPQSTVENFFDFFVTIYGKPYPL
jgi:hypothetical protein